MGMTNDAKKLECFGKEISEMECAKTARVKIQREQMGGSEEEEMPLLFLSFIALDIRRKLDLTLIFVVGIHSG